MGRRPDPHDPAFVASLSGRAARERTGYFYVEGVSALLLSRGGVRPPAAVLATEAGAARLAAGGWDGPPARVVPEEALAGISAVKLHEGAVGVFRADRPPAEALVSDGPPRVLLAERVTDPANAAGLLRLADAFGFALLAAAGTADPYGPRAARASMGAVFRVPVSFADDAAAAAALLRAAGYLVVGTPCAGGEPPSSLPAGASRVALCVGNEASGLGAPLLHACDRLVTVPLPGRVQSLSVSHAAAILMHALAA